MADEKPGRALFYLPNAKEFGRWYFDVVKNGLTVAALDYLFRKTGLSAFWYLWQFSSLVFFAWFYVTIREYVWAYPALSNRTKGIISVLITGVVIGALTTAVTSGLHTISVEQFGK